MGFEPMPLFETGAYSQRLNHSAKLAQRSYPLSYCSQSKGRASMQYMHVRAVAFAVAFAAAFAAARFCCCPLLPGSIPGLGVFCVADFSLFTPS